MSRAQIRMEERRWRRGDVLAVVGALLLGVALAWIVLSIQAMGHDLREERARGDALAQQVKELGGTPVVGPSGSKGEPGVSVTGPAGPKGDKGDPGADAPTITPSPGPTGPAGEDGADSTVPGPVGAQGPPGADSTVPGPQGPQGERGEPGSSGSPPAGWTFAYNDTEYVCSPVSDFDDSNPRYDCESDEPDPPPSTPPGQVNFALDPNRRMY